MPELPEVETIVRRLSAEISGRKIGSVRLLNPSVLRCPRETFVRTVKGSIIRQIRRKGKFILFELDKGVTLLLHLKMTGQVLLEPLSAEPDRHSHLVLIFQGGDLQLRYRDVRKFGFFDISQSGEEEPYPQGLERIAPDPFEMNAAAFIRLLSSKKGRIKPLLLDQSLISGLGNIYTDEALFQARIHPLTSAADLSAKALQDLHGVIRTILRRALRAQGSTLKDYRKPDGNRGAFQNLLRVYGREGLPCLRCGCLIQKIRVSGRGTHFCPRCQPL